MSKEKRRVPKLRFPGFTEDWEQRKLCQITTRVTRKNGGQSDLPLTISAQDGLVDQRKYFNRQVASRDMSNYYLIKKGEFAYNKSYSEGYPFGAVKRLDYYDIGALSTLYILFEITDNNISSDFIVSYYMTHLWYKEISKRAAEGARNHGLLNISTEDFFDSDLNIPNSIEEQVKIGNFIKQLDKFITLHQRKLEHLNLKKKALLQKLFPKNGAPYPELRFPGFTDAWEQRKLGDFTNQINTFVNPEDAKLPLWSLTAEAGLIEKSDRYERDFLVKKKDQFKRIETNTLVYNPMNITIGSIDIYTGLYPIAVSGYYVSIVYDKNIDTDFLKEVLLLPSSLKMYKNYATGSLIERQRVQYPTFSKLQLLLPNLDEQKAIGQLFKSLNLNITLHQRKLEHLKLQKKALLQQLFV